MGKLERDFQAGLIKEIRDLLPGCVVLKNDANYQQGIPDLSIFHGDRWATLEVKKSDREETQPNQEYFVNLMNGMSFSAFITPENKDEILDELQQALRPRRKTRVSQC